MGGAFHPYFAVGDVQTAEVTGLGETPFFDKTSGLPGSGATEPVQLIGEVDRVYGTTGGVCINDRTLSRRISVEASGHSSTVVWNPGEKECSKVRDLAPEDYLRFLAVEPAIAQGREVKVVPGGISTIEMSVQVEGLGLGS